MSIREECHAHLQTPDCRPTIRPTIRPNSHTNRYADSHSDNCPARLTQNALAVNIRHAEPEDALALNALFAEEQVIYWTIGLPFTPLQHSYKQLTEVPEGEYILVACANNNPIVGAIKLSRYTAPRLHHTASLSSLAVSSAYQGQGIGSKLIETILDLADNWLNLVRVELFIYADHKSAIALYTKYGFVIEGNLRSAAFRAGRYVDGHIMARIRPGG